ncbi:MAG: pro-sigmaK processing inhibitor BofA family protein [Limnochordia bacterium]|jgi:inhibitor of the pro-sigma K processing machinery|nr:pro-sigmaK processing inhibitor BofA family protein [Bacillota bacterium]NLL08786.1 pro-sigmaK processing inhibitor BofA [Bacillota bacterium]HBG08968.1 SigmaK-factor processing regulatory BofA [Bacillota bacterium]
MNFMVIVAYAAGVLLLYGLGKMLLIPLRTIFNLIVNAVIGGGVLLLINFVGSFWGFHVGVNPVTALVVGLLGVPGVLLLIALRLLFA